ncbi:hypothetical protein EVAR_87417_1 [Eumeta japonica]|uniref:Secreted protein n=1 Tax=Eumeta variegata TaxID=151549 RepID=A0A4C1XLE4_EUMVA|nr:hypothetical protein EVAR_87417_1 [Eumeta japonica]
MCVILALALSFVLRVLSYSSQTRPWCGACEEIFGRDAPSAPSGVRPSVRPAGPADGVLIREGRLIRGARRTERTFYVVSSVLSR